MNELEIIEYPKIINNSDKNPQDVISLLKNIYDPEIHYSIYDIGLIYGINLEKNKVHILMTLTTANCPEAISLPDNVHNTLQEYYPDDEIEVEITFEPPWTVDNMTDEIKLGLGLL